MDVMQKLDYVKNRGFEQLNWKQFREETVGKKIFLFGTGKMAGKFIFSSQESVNIYGVIDNEKKKHGICLGEFIAEAIQTKYENLIISDVSILKNYVCEEVLVIIANQNAYEQMIEQLKQYGVKKYYVFSELDRVGLGNLDSDSIRLKDFYIKECCNQEIDRKKIVISIGYYGGHGKYITEQLLKCEENLDIVWIVKDLSLECPQGVRLVYEANWKKYIYEMATAHIWVYDIALPAYIKKRPGQIYIQTKHWSSITLKKFFLDDLATTNTEEKVERIRYNGEIMDYIFSGSKFDEETCKSGFAFKGEFIRVGSARTDALFRPENKEKVYKRYHLKENVHCAIYAPTFRFVKEEHRKRFDLYLDFVELKNALEERFGGEWRILLRLHPSIAKESKKIAKDSFVVDVSDYDDSQELLAASDITISDYSSIMFEHAFINRPVFLFAPDREQYVNNERDLLLDYDKLPFPISTTNEELKAQILNFDQEEYVEILKCFMEQYEISEDGHASERAAEFIINTVKNTKRGRMDEESYRANSDLK